MRWKMSRIHTTLSQVGSWGTNVHSIWGNPPNTSEPWETNVKNIWGTLPRNFCEDPRETGRQIKGKNTEGNQKHLFWSRETCAEKNTCPNLPKNLFWSTSHWPQRTPEDKHVSFLWGTWETNVNELGEPQMQTTVEGTWKKQLYKEWTNCQTISLKQLNTSFTMNHPSIYPWMVPCPPN